MQIQGLREEEVEESRKKYGSNQIVESEPDTFWDKFKEGFKDPMIQLLLVIAGIMLVMFVFGQAEIYEPIGTIIAILLVTVISAKTELSSDAEYRKLKDSAKKDTCKVYRGGKVVMVEVDDLVVGDMVILQSGDKIHADGILVDGFLKVDNSSLNGETEECKKNPVSKDYVYTEKPITGDTFVDEHSLFRGAVVYDGEGVMEIMKVGMSTMMGAMAEDMSDAEVESPLKVKLAKLAKQISTFGYIGAIVIAIALMISFIAKAGGVEPYLAAGAVPIVKDLLDALTLAIVIIVCAVPEGLPLMISLVLMQNTSKMLRHNILVRKPIGIETAGSLNILFSDKTGTITKGQLQVVEFFDGNGVAREIMSKDTKMKQQLTFAIGKNTGAMFDLEGSVVGGNATDKALLQFLKEDEFRKLQQNETWKVNAIQNFNSTNKYSQVEIAGTGCTYYKGAPERLLEKAKRYVDENGEVRDIDLSKINKKIDELARKAMRVLAFGYSEKKLEENVVHEDLVIIGFVGIRDDVRKEAKEAIEIVQNAGIQVIMITGDRKETAIAIAKEAALYNNDKDVALTSEELNNMSDDEVKKILPNIRVIARALPTDKSRMIRICQEMNLVCGMTGDGVNDAPALKRADVGFAMGSGTDIAKEAGDIVILDDNFKSIKDAILYGRTIYHNILKFCRFQLVINVAAVLVSAIAPFLGIEEPLKVTHLLWINLVMDSLGSLALGNEPAKLEYLREKPRRRDESIVSKAMLGQIVFMGIWLTILSFIFLLVPVFKDVFFDGNYDQFLTGYFCLFILCSVVNGFNVRSNDFKIFAGLDQNKGFIKVMGIIVVVQVLLSLVGGEFFNCTPFGLKGWGIVALLSLSMIPIDMIRKALFSSAKDQVRIDSNLQGN